MHAAMSSLRGAISEVPLRCPNWNGHLIYDPLYPLVPSRQTRRRHHSAASNKWVDDGCLKILQTLRRHHWDGHVIYRPPYTRLSLPHKCGAGIIVPLQTSGSMTAASRYLKHRCLNLSCSGFDTYDASTSLCSILRVTARDS